jgi:hypothetical protein
VLPGPLSEPWRDISTDDPNHVRDREALSQELRQECGPEHSLFDREASAAATCGACDRALYQLDLDEWAIVHLTWTSNAPGWPTVEATGPWSQVSAAANEHAQNH